MTISKKHPDERVALDSDETRSFLHARANSTGNARKRGRLVGEVISLQPFRAVLNEVTDPERGNWPEDEETAA